MAENIKCPRCGFKGQMNRFVRPLSSKDKNLVPKQSKYKTIFVTEHYCPECKKWFKIL